MLNYKWFRWCKKYSHGLDSEWEYLEFRYGDTHESLEEFIREYFCDYEEDEHFRGVRIEEIDHPPKDWFIEQITIMNQKLVSLQQRINDYEDWLLTIGITEDGRND